jgi:ribokinase
MAPAVISVIGSINVDMVTRTPRVPVGGETLTAESFDIGYGGKGANQAVACARLSRTKEQAEKFEVSDVEVRMVGAVGDDQFSGGFLDALKKDGLNVESIEVLKGKKTGVSCITVETTSGQNRIMFCPGANYDVQEKDLVGEGVGVVLFQLELPMNVVSIIVDISSWVYAFGGINTDDDQVLHNMKAARDKGVEVVINPAPATPLPEDAYRGLGHLIVNETEAAILSGVDNPTNWDDVSAIFIARGVKNVIITLGGDVSLIRSILVITLTYASR